MLDVRNARDAASRLDDDEKGVVIADTLGGPQEVTTINESGLYSLILTSRKPEAKRFKKWVTKTVLPAIRRDGGYIVGEEYVATVDTLSIVEGITDRRAQQVRVITLDQPNEIRTLGTNFVPT